MAVQANVANDLLTNTGKRNMMLGMFLGISIGVHVIIFLLLGNFIIVRDMQQAERQFKAIAAQDDGAAGGAQLSDAEVLTGVPQFQTTQLLDTSALLNLELPEISIGNMNLGLGGGGLGIGGLGDLDFGNTGSTTAPALRVNELGFDTAVSSAQFNGVVFDMKRTPEGDAVDTFQSANMFTRDTTPATKNMLKQVSDWASGSWSLNELRNNYFTVAQDVPRNHFIQPQTSIAQMPRLLGVQGKASTHGLLGYYLGEYLVPDTGQYRFLGRADGILIVRVNNQVVLDASSPKPLSNFTPGDEVDKLFNVPKDGVTGQWLTLRAGQKVRIEVLNGCTTGLEYGSWLLLQQAGSGRLPQIFSIQPLSDAEKRALSQYDHSSGRF